MDYNFIITAEERIYLRELAKKQLEYANLPIMTERKKHWFKHNSLKAEKPIIVFETYPFINEIINQSKCTSPAAKEIESSILFWLANHEVINDDKVVPDFFRVTWKIYMKEFSNDIKFEHAKDSKGREIGYAWNHLIKDLSIDIKKMKSSEYHVDREYTFAWKSFVENVIGDILPVKLRNDSLIWYVAPSSKVVKLMGLEAMMYAIVDYPDEMHELYNFITEDILSYIDWQKKEGLLTLNNSNDYAGAGSYGFTDELPTEDCIKTGLVSPKDLWGNLNSQETVGISPYMYEEFVLPYYIRLAEKFGLVYYGCCEPVHDIWENSISKLPNLRKVSISPWCNEEYMGEVLKNSNIIYSRKPSPNLIGIEKYFDESAWEKHIERTLKAARGGSLEIIFRDIYTLVDDNSKAQRAINIIRNSIEKIWY